MSLHIGQKDASWCRWWRKLELGSAHICVRGSQNWQDPTPKKGNTLTEVAWSEVAIRNNLNGCKVDAVVNPSLLFQALWCN